MRPQFFPGILAATNTLNCFKHVVELKNVELIGLIELSELVGLFESRLGLWVHPSIHLPTLPFSQLPFGRRLV